MTGDPRARAALGMFALLLVVYSASIGLRATRGASITADEPFYLLTTQSIIEDGDLDLRQQYARESYRSFFDHPDGLWKQSVPQRDGRLLSPHEPGLSVLLVPGFALGGLWGAQAQMAVIAAATFALAFVLVALETRTLWTACSVTGAVAFSATAFVYSSEVYPEVPAALCVLLSLLVLRRPRLRSVDAVVLAVLLTCMAWLGMKYAPLAGALALYFLWKGQSGARLVFVSLGVCSLGTYIWLHVSVFGALTAYNMNTVYEGASTFEVLQAHLSFGDRVYRLWGLFIDQRFGVGRWAPVLLPVLPALPLLIRRGASGTLACVLIVAQVLVATFVSVTMMGYWFPGRMLVVVFPLFALVLTHLVLRIPRWLRVAGGVLAGYSIVVTALLLLAVRRGEVTLAVDPADMQAVLFQSAARFFPDYRWWTFETNALTACWLVAGIGALVMVLLQTEVRWPDAVALWRSSRRPQMAAAHETRARYAIGEE
jgi:hypothetical protein